MSDQIIHDHNQDGIDRRGFLKCMAWAGTGALLVFSGGVLRSQMLSRAPDLPEEPVAGGLSFVQISDSHIGFSKEANKDVLSTLQAAIDKINALPTPPAFVLHTGDLTHLSKPEEFDALDQLLKSVKTERIFYVPGEHDVLTDNGAIYLERRGTKEPAGRAST
jgi:3',5'-cyclic-AMP phosphodiesterase